MEMITGAHHRKELYRAGRKYFECGLGNEERLGRERLAALAFRVRREGPWAVQGLGRLGIHRATSVAVHRPRRRWLRAGACIGRPVLRIASVCRLEHRPCASHRSKAERIAASAIR
jgi:hypothetical protein